MCRLFLMHGVLAVTSSVLLAAAGLGRWAQCETSPVLCVFLFHDLRYQIHCWTRALLPLQLSSYSCLPLRGSLSSQNLSVCLSSWPCLSLLRPLLLICLLVISPQPPSLHIWLSIFFFWLSFVYRVITASLSVSVWSPACTWQTTTST